MANHQLLNNVTHKNLKVITERSALYGDNVATVLTFPAEFRSVQGSFPICFCKDSSTEEFHSAVVFGFEDNENLFLDGDAWTATYVPLMLERQPFLIGQPEDNADESQLLLHIDMDSPRVSNDEGKSVFLEFGGNSPFLQHISSVMRTIYEGRKQSRHFIDMLVRHELIEAFTLNIPLDDGSNNQLLGFYTIAEEKLNGLPDQIIIDLMRNGYLQAIYMVIASFSNFRDLIARKNRRLC